mmetsp:Transcript_16569/g.46247  ORF Transcript_16569/g.46247 Transcript_16569/m.46247 type:complete len:761 (-) Transcript_16569:85-2367(-)|eukprot:CAMPEP_0117670288 /NCGR_PEP_ID=MMETSP0804-20121206/12660_1 /TAXON_ID=1074897 /ORGANISM="Tetraselmis astigmatica, Strain CCMP880" /LENGTH=760 /DNA_ID=CAMNT_0005478551 /DNA_START=328 /DNA_END=2610 /DNA_ORIENTATION=-
MGAAFGNRKTFRAPLSAYSNGSVRAVLLLLAALPVLYLATGGLFPRIQELLGSTMDGAPGSGVHLLPLNNPDAIIWSSGSVFDGFESKYFCSENASAAEHKPTLLFEQPVVQQATSQSAKDSDVDLLVGILSACDSAGRRDIVRQTWQRLQTAQHGTWRAVFVLGNCDSQAVMEEQQRYGDLLFTSPKESYYVLTRKVLEFFSYAVSVNASYALKTDDDAFIFIDRVLQELKGMDSTCLYWGSHSRGYLPHWWQVYGKRNEHMHVLTVPTVKWYIPPDDLTLINEVPYMPGGAYILSSNLIKQVLLSQTVVPDHLPEDATIASLVGKSLVKQCSCADSRHIKDVDGFQGLRLMDIDGTGSDVEACELSNVVHRSLTIHGLHEASQLTQILRVATTPLMRCEDSQYFNTTKTHLSYAKPSDRYSAIWGRPLPNRGHHSVYGEALAYSEMVHTATPWEVEYCPACTGDRPMSYQYLLRALKHLGIESRTPAGFRRAYAEISKLKPDQAGLQDTSELVPMAALLTAPAGGISWCQKLEWAVQVAEMVVDLSQERLLLCDLHLKRVYVNSSSLHAVLSAGRSQWMYSETRFRSDAWCFSDAQCHACFKPSITQPMAWLPEASCNATTGRCQGFDGTSQASAALEYAISPLLEGIAEENFELWLQVSALKATLTAPREDLSTAVTDDSRAYELLASLRGLSQEHGSHACAEGHREATAKKVAVHTKGAGSPKGSSAKASRKEIAGSLTEEEGGGPSMTDLPETKG